MGVIADKAAVVFRELETPGFPSAGKHLPGKNEHIELFEIVEQQVTSDGVLAETWPALFALIGTYDGQGAESSDTDPAHTHTDPVTGATVPDGGRFRWATSPATGWKWISASAVSLKADKVTTVTGGGLASGGGSLAASRVITVTEAADADILAGTDGTKVVTSRKINVRFSDVRASLASGIYSLLNSAAASISIGVKSLLVNATTLIEATDTGIEELGDDAGRIVRRVATDGTHSMVAVDALETKTGQLTIGSNVRLTEDTDPLSPVWRVEDPSTGYISTYLDKTGLLRTAEVQTPVLGATSGTFKTLMTGAAFRSVDDKRIGRFQAEIVHILWRGQSWALGWNSTPSINTVQRYDNLTFNGGVRQLYSVASVPTALQSFVPAVEIDAIGTPEDGAAVLGETGAVAAGNTIKELIQRENNLAFTEHSFQLLFSCPDEGGKSIEDLANNALAYTTRCKEQIARAFAIATSLGKTYEVGAITWMQGNGASDATYPAQLEAMRLDIDTYAKSVTGQVNDVKLITWELTASSDTQSNVGSVTAVQNRYIKAADTYPHIYCSGPSYPVGQLAVGNIHYGGTAMDFHGRSMGVALKRVLVDLVDYQPVRPVSIRRAGNFAIVKINVQADRLSLDTVNIAAFPNYGFNLFDAARAEQTISSVALVGPDTIKITAADPIQANWRLCYAGKGNAAVTFNKFRGNVRTSGFEHETRIPWLIAFDLPFDN